MSYPTWSDLNSPSIVPPLGARQAPDIGPAALLVSTEPDLKYIRSRAGALDRRPFFMGSLMTDRSISVAGPYIGAPYAVMLLESLVAKGASRIFVLGWCGGLGPALSPGDLVVPDRALVDEGTSRHYTKLDGAPAEVLPDSTLSDALVSHLEHSGHSPRRLPVWTTDAIYRETREKVRWFSDRGAGAVEMECSALFAAAAYRKIPVAALLVVSDSLVNGEWHPGFRSKRFKIMRKTACDQAIALIRTIADDL